MDLVEAVRKCVAPHVPSGDRILVGVSGGPDSCALLHALAGLRSSTGVHVSAAHVHHGMRGADADADAAFVEELCARLDVPCVVRRCDAAGAARRMHVSRQEAARLLRMELLREAAASCGASWIAFGHTLDDHVETVLMNILRGTGVDGLAGIAEVDAPFIRPLRVVRRSDTIGYCTEHGIEFRMDATNASFAYLRNRVRSELLPMLAAYYNPAVVENLERLSRLASEESAFLDALARDQVEKAAVHSEAGGLILRASSLAGVPAAMRRRMIREGIRLVHGHLYGVEYRHIDRISRAVEEPWGLKGFVLTLPGGAAAVRICGDAVEIQGVPAPVEVCRRSWELALPGDTPIPELGIRVTARYAQADEAWVHKDARTAVLHAAALAPPLKVRTRLPGDRLRPMGLGGTKKVQDLMVDAKIPRRDRARIPIIEDEAGILWVVGCALDERARVPAEAARVVVLHVSSVCGD